MALDLSNITDERRQEMQRKAAEKKAAKQQWAKNNLKLNWADKKHWQELASKHGFRLPVYYEPAKSKFVNRFLKHFGLSQEWYQDVTGYSNGNQEGRANPNMPAFAQVGLLLEALDEIS